MVLLSDYKEQLQLYPELLKLKSEIQSILIKKSLSSFMNDSKWIELINQVNQLTFPPPYFEKSLLEETASGHFTQNEIPDWHGNWSPFYEEGLAIFESIEYLEIYPKTKIVKGRLIAPDIFDISNEFEDILKHLRIPYYIINGIYRITPYQ